MPEMYDSSFAYDTPLLTWDGRPFCGAVLPYDSLLEYDSAIYDWDGNLIGLNIKEVIYRELKFNILAGLVAEDHIQLDMRLSPEPYGTASWVILRRITESETDSLIRERWELEVVVPKDNDSTLEAIRTAILDGFSGTFRTWGKYEDDGSEKLCGKRIRCHHISTVEEFDSTLEEKSSLLIFALYHVR